MEMGDTRPQYPIGVVARRTGLSPHALRAWERRYGVVTPARSAGGTRLYSNADILRLRLLRRATEAGLTIGQAAQLSTEELLGLAREEAAASAAGPRPGRGGAAGAFTGPILSAVEAMDGARIHATLVRAAVSLGAREFTRAVAVPLLREVGSLWQNGRLCPAHEHLFSVQLRRVLAWLLESLPVADSAPGAVATTPSGQAHELGALLAALVSAGEGWRVSYFGPDLPAADIATAVEVTGARVVLLSVVSRMSPDDLLPQVRALHAALRSDVVVLVGGSGASEHADALAGAGAAWLPDLEGLAAMLHTLAPNRGAAAGVRAG